MDMWNISHGYIRFSRYIRLTNSRVLNNGSPFSKVKINQFVKQWQWKFEFSWLPAKACLLKDKVGNYLGPQATWGPPSADKHWTTQWQCTKFAMKVVDLYLPKGGPTPLLMQRVCMILCLWWQPNKMKECSLWEKEKRGRGEKKQDSGKSSR